MKTTTARTCETGKHRSCAQGQAHGRSEPGLSALLFVALQLVAVGCSTHGTKEARDSIQLLAVLPVDVVEPEWGVKVAEEETPEVVPSDAGQVVTAQIYGALAERPQFRVVPDLSVTSLLASERVRRAKDLRERALALGRAAEADGVIFGKVSQFRERVGTELGARSPAAVDFQLELVDVRKAEVVWQGRFEEIQEPLSSNLLQFWMFWRGGPRWLSASELTRIGVDRLLKDMRKKIGE
jgi:hypothetical protein